MIALTVNLDVASAKWKNAFPRMKSKIEKAAGAALAGAGLKKGAFEINLLLATDARIRTLNRDWRGMDKPTNVLSFPQLDLRRPGLVPGPKRPSGRLMTLSAHVKRRADALLGPGSSPGRHLPLGDIILALETIRRECRAERKPLENHTIHLVVHGVLHLLGHDHIKAKDAKTMEKLECDILRRLGYPDPYHVHAAENG